jgi:hypothetical protein
MHFFNELSWGSPMINESQGSSDFRALSESEQERYRSVSHNLVQLVQRHAIPLAFAPPRSIGGKVNGATGCIVRLDSGPFIITASHVLDEYEKRIQTERINWQFGHLTPFDPLSRVAWRDAKRDVVFFEMLESEVCQACDETSLVFSPVRGWPPPRPTQGQVVLVAGYPRILREVGSDVISSGPYSALFRVSSTGEGYFYCQIEHEDLISFDGGALPPPDADVGGLSGGPAVLMLRIDYPLVGIVTEHSQAYNILRISTLHDIPLESIRRTLPL